MSELGREPLLINTGDTSHPTPIGEAILDGYAPGKELYTFAEFPTISQGDLTALSGKPYSVVFHDITRRMLGDALPDDAQKWTAELAYAEENFDFNDGDIRVATLPSGIQVVGLSDGPTGAFKDMAMQPFAMWMRNLMQKKGDPLSILLSTSGDTGPAALDAFGNLPDTEIICMLPSKGVSPFQLAQMTEMASNPNIHVLEVEGDFSAINDLHMEADSQFDFSSANSVNIARVVAQIPYYVASYLKAIEDSGGDIGDPVDVSIPSGNFGNGLSAIIARKMGVPIRKIIVATNENNTLDLLFSESALVNTFHHSTDSSAQDIRMPSNVWRYFSALFGNDVSKIARMYENYAKDGVAFIDEAGIVDESVWENITSMSVKSRDRARTIEEVYRQTDRQIMIDPHTANGVAAVDMLEAKEPGVPMLAMETAKPFKFGPTMKKILGVEPPRPERFVDLEANQFNRKLHVARSIDDLLSYIRDNTNARPKKSNTESAN